MILGNIEDLKEGMVIKGVYWPEEVRVHVIKKVGQRVQIIGSGLNTHKSYQSVYGIDDFLKKIDVVGGIEGPKLTANPRQFRLALETQRIRMSYEFDPLFAVGVSKIDPLPHQIEAVYDYLLKKPRIRFLLADDPGAGKTIMAGLLMKELKYRKAIEKIIIVAPPALVLQWERELSEKFGETFMPINRGIINTLGNNVWEQYNQFLVSIDFVSRSPDILEQLKKLPFQWDLAIVDEAHKLSAYKYGEKQEKSLRYKFGEVLSETSEHLLFLTATPHKGDPENFRLLLDLLEKDLYANTNLIAEAIANDENPIMLRRLKEDMRYEDGRPIFPPRRVQTMPYKLTASEKMLYEAVTDYVRENFEKAERLENHRVSFALALIVLQRRLASSVRAIRKSLIRRAERLQSRLDEWNKPRKKEEDIEYSEDEYEDMTESDRWEIENKSMGLTTATSRRELEDEIRQVEELARIARDVENEGNEKKLNELRKTMDIEEIHSNPEEKLLIFTEHKDTLDYLKEKIEQWGFSVCNIDGSMSMEDRKQAEDDFKNKCQIMVATEAAGEGINLQFCKLMVNYDIPWNPTRLEQRMGRIHRYGQTHEVHIYNMIAEDTREGEVLARILEKLELMREHLGSDRVYDVINELFAGEGIKFEDIMRRAIMNRISKDEFQKINKIDMDDKERLAKASEEALATRFVNLERYKEKKELAEEYRLIPEYIEQFFVDGFKYFDGKIKKVEEEIYRIDEVPVIIRKRSSDKVTQNKRYYSKISFSKYAIGEDHSIEFVSPGHPLFESLCDLILEKFQSTLSEGTIFFEPEASEEGVLWFLKGSVSDGKGKQIGEKLFAIRQNTDGKLVKKGPFIVWDLNPCEKPNKFMSLFDDFKPNEDDVAEYTINKFMEPYYKELENQIYKDLEIKQKYLKRSLTYLINQKIILEQKYEEQAKRGKDMRLNLSNVQRDIENYRHRKDTLLDEIEREKNLSMGLPEVIAVVGLVPYPTDNDKSLIGMKRDDEIERIAMEVSMNYEIKNKRNPIDVSKDNDGCGFDIKSKGIQEVRYIEVKGRAQDGFIFITPNEWIKAKRLGDKYWLYVVSNCATNPILRIIQNPAANITPDEIEKVVRFKVENQQIKDKGNEVNI
jgi:superfamily II DNA or RNA helicase